MDDRSPHSNPETMKRRQALRLMGTGTMGLAATAGLTRCGHAQEPEEKQDQTTGPLRKPHLYVCGIHAVKANPGFQIETQHYCSMLNEDVHQCLLYDSAKRNAKLLGVEYIISDKLYRKLPEEEKKYWHPHTYEVLSGLLVAPDLPPGKEQELMRALLTTWGKAWHTWPDPTTDVPVGEPLLIWSLTGDGQTDEKLLAQRDRRLGISTRELREARTNTLGYEVPQIDQPETLDAVGRQWTNEGPDKPRRANQ